MEKQQLASKIWNAADKMRSNIEPNEYKDYILGLIFYRFLSNQIEDYYRQQGVTDEELLTLEEDEDPEYTDYIRKNMGYFIGYSNLFSTWLKKGSEFGVKNVSEALSAFNRLVYPTHKKVFAGIFDTLETGLKNLGNSDTARTLALSKLINLIKDIPMDGNNGYDMLGYIYEYLISNFAASAGKKAGEFYTPHEVSVLMAEIVAHHLKDKERIEIYDPTSGSGSLLITIGKAVAKHNDNPDNIKYYAQELKRNTYNLTRMNLVMRGIKPHNIITRNGDTLERGKDWPMFDDGDVESSYQYRPMDAVVSNPPYSQRWDRPADKDSDPRYKNYGLAPKKPADYAFLLHDLYHLKADGIMAIVLPHGVLFRPGDEAEIRKNLIERNNIEAIIGLPADIFFGTPIATLIMVLKANRDNSDVLFVDASKYSTKSGKKKILQASDIKRIFDAVVSRPKEIEKFARLVSIEEIRANDYDLNIPKYVDSSIDNEKWNLCSLLHGGVPRDEINDLSEYWEQMPNLRKDLFPEGEYVECTSTDVSETIEKHQDIETYKQVYESSFHDYDSYLTSRLIDRMMEVNIAKEIDILGDDLFHRLSDVPLLEKYTVFQALSDCWEIAASDLEIIQTEGKSSLKKVEPNMVIVKNGDEETEVQKGMRGRIMPFDLVQRIFLPDKLDRIKVLTDRLSDLTSEMTSIVENATEEDMAFLNEEGDRIDAKKLVAEVKLILNTISTPETELLHQYLALSSKREKQNFVSNHSELPWGGLTPSKNGGYSKSEINKAIANIQAQYKFPENTYEYRVLYLSKLLSEQKEIKSEIKDLQYELNNETIFIVESLTDEQIKTLLFHKWVLPVVSAVRNERDRVISTLCKKVKTLVNKYATTLTGIDKSIKETETHLATMIGSLRAEGSNLDALQTLQNLLKHD